jgi:hypothetical protein
VSGRSGTTAGSTAFGSAFDIQTTYGPSSVSSGYNVLIFPEDQISRNDICCHRIGHGDTICVRLHVRYFYRYILLECPIVKSYVTMT